MSDVVAHEGLLTDTKLHVVDTGGSGRPVVLIHGWPLSSASWKEQIPALTAAGYRAVAYDRRGFGQSDKPLTGYTYDTLTEDLASVIEALDLRDLTLVGFSMGGGEVARYLAHHDASRVRSAVLAGAITPYMLQTSDNPEGPLTTSQAASMTKDLTLHRDDFFDDFTTMFFSAGDDLKVTEAQRQEAIALCQQSDQTAALACMQAFGITDFREDLPVIGVPTLVIHGDSDAVVPFEGSGKRSHEAIVDSELVVVPGAPHGFNVSHAEEFNAALLAFLDAH